MNSFTFSCSINANEFVKANNLVLVKNRLILTLLIMLAFLSLFGLVLFLTSPYSSSFNHFGFPLVFIIVFFVIRPMQLRSNFNKSKKLQAEITYTFDNEKFIMKTEDVEEKWAWNEIKHISETKDFYFFGLISPKGQYRFIPKRVIAEANKLSEFSAFIKERVSYIS